MVPKGIALSLTVLPIMGVAQESLERAEDARLLWSAFECSYFAFSSNQEEEGARLFELGYDRGQRFIKALLAGEINEGDYSSVVPLGVSLLINGPSADFALGRIFEASQSDAADSLSAANPDFPFDEELRRLSAASLYDQHNCRIIR